jgi:hypothetical protein
MFFVVNLLKDVIIVRCIKKILVVLSFFLAPCAVYGAVQGISVSCSIESEGYLSKEPVSLLTDIYKLTEPPTLEGGRHLIFQNKQHELWVKTHSYLREGNNLSITAFSVLLIDMQKKQMVEAASSTIQVPRHGTLTVHGLSDDMALTGRLVVSCIESIN